MVTFKRISKLFTAIAAIAILSGMTTSCINDNETIQTESIPVVFNSNLPDEIGDGKVILCNLSLTELNSGQTYLFNLLDDPNANLPVGLYNYEGTAKVKYTTDGEDIVKTMRASGNSVELTGPKVLTLDWFFSNPDGSLVFSEIYASGSPNATATGGIRDTYLRIYNNTEETIYADGLAICESAFINARASTFEILTEANNRENNFTAGTIWVIPGNGTDYPILPGESLKIVDQAIDWSAQVSGALNHTDADFEWYDDNVQDTDNHDVPNLKKWYCYSNTIWIISNQCNRSYALVRFPEGMTAEKYLAEYHGVYDYIHTTGAHMSNEKAYLIPLSWIVDGVNLGNDETYVIGAHSKSVDISYASISEVNSDKNRFGKKFQRKVSTTLPSGVQVLMDTNDSANDFERVSVK